MGEPDLEKKFPTLEKEMFIVYGDADDLLLLNKTPKYINRFKSWARNTQGEHLDNLTSAMLSAIAYATVTGRSKGMFDERYYDYLGGQAQGILMIKEKIRTYASDSKVIIDDEL